MYVCNQSDYIQNNNSDDPPPNRYRGGSEDSRLGDCTAAFVFAAATG